MKTTTLKNGITVATLQKESLSSTVAISFAVGSHHETKEQSGMAHFLEHIMFKGTTNRTSDQVTHEIEVMGSNFNAFTSTNATSYYVEGLASNLSKSFNVLADMVKNPLLDQDEINRERNVIHQEISMYEDDAIDSAIRELNHRFTNEECSRPIIGSHESIDTFNHDNLMQFYRSLYTTDAMVVSMVGPMPHEEFVAMVDLELGGMEQSPAVHPNESSMIKWGDVRIRETKFNQTIGIVSYELPMAKCVKETRVFSLLSSVLSGGMSSPLMLNVRDRAGLCYFVTSMYSRNRYGNSSFVMYGGTAAETAQQMVDMSIAELERIANDDFLEEDIERARNALVYGLAKSDDSISSLHSRIRGAALEGFDYYDSKEVLRQYNEVSRQDIVDAAKQVIASKRVKFIYG